MRVLGRVKGWLAVLLVVLVAACSDNNDPGDTSLTIENESGTTIAIVNFSDCDDPEWGEDRLDDDEFLEDGESKTFDVDEGCYDIRVIFVGGASETQLDNQIDDGEEFVYTVTD
jgi:hypothetical protein